MGIAYWSGERLDHLRHVLSEGITGATELMGFLAEESNVVRHSLMEARSPNDKHRMSTLLILVVVKRKDAAPTLQWHQTRNVGPAHNRRANWRYIPRGGRGRVPGYTKQCLRKYAASEEELELMWDIEQVAAPLRAAMTHWQRILDSIDSLEKAMNDAQFITRSGPSQFSKAEYLGALYNGDDIPVTSDDDLCNLKKK